MQRHWRARLSGEWLLTTALALVVLSVLAWTDTGRAIGNRLYDQFSLSQRFQASPDIVVIAIDERTRKALGPWPIPRNHYAALIDRLASADRPPLVLGIDLLFFDAGVHDAKLAIELARVPVVLPYVLAPAPRTADVPAPETRNWQLPLPALAAASAGQGHIHVRFDPDGVIRGVQARFFGMDHFSLAMLKAGGRAYAPALLADEYLRFRMVDPFVGFTTISLLDALNPDFALPDLRNKWLLLGVTDPALGDQHATIYSGASGSATPGVAILASALNAGIRDQWIRLVPQTMVFGLSCAAVLMLQLALYLLRLRQVMLLGSIVLVSLVGLSYLLLRQANWWFDIAPLWVTTALLWLFWAWRRLDRAVHFMHQKTANLPVDEVRNQNFAINNNAPGNIVDYYTDRLDRAIDLQGEHLLLLEQILRHIPEPVAVLDSQDQLLQANQAMRDLWSQEGDSLPMAPVNSLAELLGRLGQPVQSWEQFNRTALANADTTVQIPTPSGARHVYVKTAQVAAAGQRFFRLLTLVDVTDLRRYQTQRDQALGFLSHDMRTPVASILAVTSQMRGQSQPQPQSGEQAERSIQRIISHANELMRLMDGFLIESRAHGETLQLSERLIDDIVDDAVSQAQDLAALRGMQLHVRGSECFFFVQVASQLMVRALLNLLLNAIKYGEPGTEVLVELQQGGSVESPQVDIIISNTVASDKLKVDQSVITQGFGLGLDFVSTVIHRHQGQLRLDIPKSGQARVFIHLPCLVVT
jgi:CHASE2 domain-containing sensor protein/nitrogen-specific signal transduction histidine kinase